MAAIDTVCRCPWLVYRGPIAGLYASIKGLGGLAEVRHLRKDMRVQTESGARPILAVQAPVTYPSYWPRYSYKARASDITLLLNTVAEYIYYKPTPPENGMTKADAACFVECELSGLVSSLASYNGTHVLGLDARNFDVYNKWNASFRRWNGFSWQDALTLGYSGSYSFWAVSATSNEESVGWRRYGPVSDPEGSYTFFVGPQSQATCRVRWAGAIWP